VQMSKSNPLLFMFQLLRTRRPFVAEITDAMGNETFKVIFLQDTMPF
jgi:hypothetical protein